MAVQNNFKQILEAYLKATLLVFAISSILFFFVWLLFLNSPERVPILAAVFSPIISINVIVDAFRRGVVHIFMAFMSAGVAGVAAFFLVRFLLLVSTSFGLHGGLFH